MSGVLRELHDPAATGVPQDFTDFLRWLGTAAVLHLSGSHGERTRALSVLVHGNETSGPRALHRWLREGLRPHDTVLAFVGGVAAALHPPALTHRCVPGERDLNRCFRAPFGDRPGQLAQALLERLHSAHPTSLVDIHNTSTPGPAFGVAPHEDVAHEALTALFCSNLVITDLRLGALMEISAPACPAVTIECGAASDPRADRIAWEGLLRYLQQPEVPGVLPAGTALELFHHPVRLEFEPGTRLAWGDAAVAGADFTVRTGLERSNFATVDPGQVIGWLGPRGLAPLRVRDGRGADMREVWFRASEGRLHTRQPLRFFMITASAQMALADCLLYASPEREHTRLGG